MNKHDWFLFYMLCAFLFGCFSFLYGFFPIDLQKGDIVPSPEYPTLLAGHNLTKPSRAVSKVVLMVVDGLRYDFVSNENMPYSDRQCNIILKTNVPTVTLPRIKSLATGTISNFIDVVLNVGKPTPIEDSIFHKLDARGEKIVFYGDAVWADLFSSIFTRYGASSESFNFKKYYEADSNITKSLNVELRNLNNWDHMILHYFGLDNIGHMDGSNYEKISSKLREMDDVVKTIDNALSKMDSGLRPLVLVTADHGMRVGGGHGGASPEEIYVPLVATKHNCTRQDKSIPKYSQIDIVATLAILLDVPIPGSSIGIVIPELLIDMTDEEVLSALYYNTHFLVEKAFLKFGEFFVRDEDWFSWYLEAIDIHTKYLTQNTSSSFYFKQAKLNYMRAAADASNLFASSYSRFNYGYITMGLLISTFSALLVVLACLTRSPLTYQIENPYRYHMVIVTLAGITNFICHCFGFFQAKTFPQAHVAIIPMLIAYNLLFLLVRTLLKKKIYFDIPLSLVVGVLFQTFSMVSTSFIEEEHQSWYYLGITFYLSLIWNNISKNRLRNITISTSTIVQDLSMVVNVLRPVKKAFIAVGITIFVRRLNQTGDKWMRLPDIGDWFILPANKRHLSTFLIISLALLVIQMKKFNNLSQTFATMVACMSVYCYRGVVGSVIFFENGTFNSVLVVPLFWICLLYIIVTAQHTVMFDPVCRKEKFNKRVSRLLGANVSSFALMSALLHKPHNVILIFAISYMLRNGYNMCDTLRGAKKALPAHRILIYKVALTICVSKMFYFYQGNSNSLATIDLNPGFIGINTYNPIIAGSLMTSNTFFAEIFGFFYLIQNIFEKSNPAVVVLQINDNSEKTNYNLVTAYMAAAKLISLTVYLYLVVGFRHHLFIFSVFSPKILYSCYDILLFFVNVSMTNLYFRCLNKII